MLKPYQKAQVTFDLVKEIGTDGRNSRTFVSRDHQLDAEIVIKQIAKGKLASPANFFDESKALYASAHPNVVPIHYACEDDDFIYLAMPYYRKGSVKGLITGRHLSVRRIVTLGAQVLTGLHNIHSKRLIHFDVKPDNILLTDREEALLSDFGQAKQMNFSGKAIQDRPYTPMVPPEFTKSDQFDVTYDIYQFGLTLYRMCNGNEVFYRQLAKYGPPSSFDRETFRFDLRTGRFPDRKVFPAHIPAKLRKIIRTCLEPDPSARYGSALEVSNALADIDGEILDWHFVQTPDTSTWTKNENGTSYELTLKLDGTSEFYRSVSGGQRRRIMEGCRPSLSDKDVQRLLGSY
ncbi:serine/threonine-protein kinase [Microvirga sp. 2MCAF35]|uniref:serine/threonine-protein kinase n=1 Tax=Microvirga sp. 2MCAF35 TaxID=3232987 RepID=UPI003F99D61E